MTLLKVLQEVDVKEVSKSLKNALDDSVREKSIWERAYEIYSKNPTEVTIGVVVVVVAVYAVYLFKFDDKYSTSNGFKVTKYKEEIERFKKMESDKLKTNSNKDSGGIF